MWSDGQLIHLIGISTLRRREFSVGSEIGKMKRALITGIYIIKFTAKNPATGKTWENVQTVVLAKKL